MDNARSRSAAVTLGLLVLSGCAFLEPATELRVGQTESEVTQRLGEPAGRHVLAQGASRLEYPRGPAGRTTWMVDLDASGRVTAVEQVLTEANFYKVTDGMPVADLLRLLGRPGHRAGEWQNRETWSWRYPTNDCLWARITVTAEGVTRGGVGFMPDPACDVKEGNGMGLF